MSDDGRGACPRDAEEQFGVIGPPGPGLSPGIPSRKAHRELGIGGEGRQVPLLLARPEIEQHPKPEVQTTEGAAGGNAMRQCRTPPSHPGNHLTPVALPQGILGSFRTGFRPEKRAPSFRPGCLLSPKIFSFLPCRGLPWKLHPKTPLSVPDFDSPDALQPGAGKNRDTETPTT